MLLERQVLYKIGGYRFMEIKYGLIKAHRLFFILLICTSFLYSDDENLLSKNIISTNPLDKVLPKKGTDQLDPLDGIQLNFNKIVNKFNKEIPRESLDGELLFLNKGEYIQLKGIDNRILLFDGSFRIQFRKTPNLSDYASSNGLQFVESLSDINIGVFKTNNLSELSLIAPLLKNDDNVISISLNTVDPSLKNQ